MLRLSRSPSQEKNLLGRNVGGRGLPGPKIRTWGTRRLVKALNVLGYQATRQKGSHIRLTTQRDGENHEVIPRHDPIKTGTLANILKRIVAHHGLTVGELLEMLEL